MLESNEPLPSLETLQRRIDKAEVGSLTKSDEAVDEAAADSLAKAAKLAWSIVSGTAVGILGGYILDRWLNSSPWFLLVGFFLGFAVGLYSLMLKLKNNN